MMIRHFASFVNSRRLVSLLSLETGGRRLVCCSTTTNGKNNICHPSCWWWSYHNSLTWPLIHTAQFSSSASSGIRSRRRRPSNSGSSSSPSPSNGSTKLHRRSPPPSTKFNHDDEEPGEYDKRILNVLNQGRYYYVNYKKLDRVFAEIYNDMDDDEGTGGTSPAAKLLQLDTFYSLVHRIQHAAADKDPVAVEYLEHFLLGWMMKFHQERRLDRQPKHQLFGNALLSYAKSNRHHHQHDNVAGEMAENFLHKLEQFVEEGDLPMEIIDIAKYNIVLKTYAKRGDFIKAQDIFDRCMRKYKEEGNKSLKPDIVTWGTLIDAYGKSGKHNAGEMALEQLRKAEKEEGSGIQQLNTICYSAVIDAFAQTNKPQEAEKLLQEMHDIYYDTSRVVVAGPSSSSTTTTVQPDMHSFTQVLNAWAKSDHTNRAQRSESVLNLMIQHYQNKTLPQIRPTATNYSTVISTYGKLGLPRDAGRILEKQCNDFLVGNNQAAKPRLRSFLGVLEGWFNSGEAIAGEKAELMLEHMIKLEREGTLLLQEKPNVFIYSAIMEAWGRLGNPERAERIFRQMLHDYEKEGNVNAKPNEFSYCALLNAYALGELPDAGELADVAMDHMRHKMKVKPDISVYTAALKCWQCSRDHHHDHDHNPKARKRCKDLEQQIRGMARRRRTSRNKRNK